VITYRRFAKAADAIRFAVEELLAAKLADASDAARSAGCRRQLSQDKKPKINRPWRDTACVQRG
jgi:hypothetical protein